MGGLSLNGNNLRNRKQSRMLIHSAFGHSPQKEKKILLVLTEEDIFCACQILYTDYNKRGDAKMYVKDVVNQDYRKWKRGDCVFVEAPTGSGKTTFILDVLLPYAQAQGTEILYLSNRFMLKEQIKTQLMKKQNIPQGLVKEEIEEFDGITVLNYQKLQMICELQHESKYLNERYRYIVCDEIHYLLEDAAFNPETLRALKFLKQTKEILIGISATIEGVDELLIQEKYGDAILWNSQKRCTEYLTQIDIWGYLSAITGEYRHIFHYKLPQTVKVNQIFSFKDYELVIEAIRRSDDKEKWLIFQSNKKKAEELRKRLGKQSHLICADNRSDAILKELIQEEKFSCRILISTKLLDNGVNVKDMQLKNILIDSISKTEFLQMLGRKRLMNEKDGFTLYIPQKSIRTFQGYFSPDVQDIYSFLNADVSTDQICRKLKEKEIYEKVLRFCVWEKGKFVKNPLAVEYYCRKKRFVEKMLEKMKDDKWAFVKEQLSWLGGKYTFNPEFSLEYKSQKRILEMIYSQLCELNERRLDQNEQRKLREWVTQLLIQEKIVPSNGSRVMGKKALNEFCRSHNLPFIIESMGGKHKGEETIWIVRRKEACSGL